MDMVNQLITFDGNNADEFIEDLRNRGVSSRATRRILFKIFLSAHTQQTHTLHIPFEISLLFLV